MRLIYTDKNGDTIFVDNVKVAHLDKMVSVIEEDSSFRIWTPVGREPMIEIKYSKTIAGTKQ